MSVVGLDVGNENCIVGVARQRGIDVVLNDESKRETPGMVSFGEKQRYVGVAGAASAMMNPRNTISQIKRMIGRPFLDPELQRDFHLFPFTVTEGPDRFPLIIVQYLGELRQFTPTQLLGMLLSNLKSIAEKNLGTSVADCVIGVPVYFTELQRRAYLDAAQVAGLHPLRLMHETTATALAYGIYKTDLSDTEPINVAFVDIGHASMQVCIAAFKKGQLKILGHSFERTLGGRDFDEVLFKYFATKFYSEYNIDVPSNARASLRLRAACEKAKKILSANPIAPLNIECLMDEKDVKGFIKRDEFEELAKPILEKVRGPCERALALSKLSIDKIFAVEVVGSGSRVPAILKILSSVFGKEPSRTMNASECIARGCTLQCAMLSPTFRVRDFEVQDSFPFAIGLSWKGTAPETEGEDVVSSDNIVFVKGNPVPSTKLLTFYRSSTFSIDAFYGETGELPANMSPRIATFTIGPFTPTLAEKAKVKVKIRLNLHGVVSLEAATIIEEEVGILVTKNEVLKDGFGEKVLSPIDAMPEDASTASANNNSAEGDATMVTETPKPEIEKKKSKRIDVPVYEVIHGGLSQPELTKAIKKENEMALQDRIMEETKESKNAVEAYVYSMRNKLYDKLQDYVTHYEREEMSVRLQETEDWLYEDGDDENKSVYTARLAELKKLGDPLETRQREEELRGPASSELMYCISSFREAAQSEDLKFDHIHAADKEKVISECNKAEEWLKDKKRQQDASPKSANPVLLVAELKKKTQVLDRFCKPIMTKARPVPSKPAPTAEPKPAPAGHAPCSGDASAPEPMDTNAHAPAPEFETMQTE